MYDDPPSLDHSLVTSPRSFSRLSLVLLLLPLAVRVLGAQAPDTARIPDSEPRLLAPLPEPSFPSTSLAQAAGWSRWNGAPIVFLTPSHVVLVTTPLSQAWLSAHDGVASRLGECRDFVPAAEIAAGAGPWQSFDSAAGSAPLIMIQIMPAMRRGRPSCQGTAPPPAALAIRGVALLERPAGAEYQYPTRAAVRIGGRAIAPVLYGRVPVKVLSPPSGAETRRDTIPQLRLYIPATELRPDSLGRLPTVSVRVWEGDGRGAVDIALPTAVVRQLWDDFLPWRLERLGDRTPGTRAPPLPAPADTALRTAWRRYGEGEFQSAALLTEQRLRTSPLTRDDSLAARVQLAYALLALRDTADAGPAIRTAMNDNPCLTLAPSAPPGYEERFDRARPRARCDVAVGRTIANGLIFPGYGQLSRGRPFGIVFSAGSAITLTYAAIRYASSRSKYDSYESNPNTQAAVDLYHEASRARTDARNAALAGIGIWLLGALEAGINEMHHGAEVRRVRSYGVAPMARSDAGRTELGLSLAF